MNSKEYLRSTYPNIVELRKYAGNVFSKHGEMKIVKGELLPKNFEKKYGNSITKLSYEQLLDVVIDYENSYLSERKEKKSKSGGIHTVNEFQEKPFEIKHIFQNGDSSNDTIIVVIAIVIILIVLFFILKMIFNSRR
jgi:hypothetical protein